MILVDNIGAISEVLHLKGSDSPELNREHLIKVREILKSDSRNFLRCGESNIERSFEKNEFDKELSSLHTNWTSKSMRFAIDVEKWAAQRRSSIRCIEELRSKLERVRILSSLGRVVFSTVDAVGTGIAIFLKSVQSSWSQTVLHTSGAMGLSGLAVALIEDYVYKTSLTKIVEELRKDQELFLKIRHDFRKLRELDKRIQNLFPYGIDERLLEFVQSRSIDDSSERDELFNTLKPIGLLEGDCVISLVVILSNARNDVSLLDNEKFIQSVKKFSTSKFVKEWWNRTLNLEKFPSSSVPQAISKLQNLSKIDMSSLHRIQVPLITTPAMFYEGIPSILSIFLNSMMAVDAFFELTKKEDAEGSSLSRLMHALKKEYNEVIHLNEVLNPYYN